MGRVDDDSPCILVKRFLKFLITEGPLIVFSMSKFFLAFQSFEDLFSSLILFWIQGHSDHFNSINFGFAPIVDVGGVESDDLLVWIDESADAVGESNLCSVNDQHIFVCIQIWIVFFVVCGQRLSKSLRTFFLKWGSPTYLKQSLLSSMAERRFLRKNLGGNPEATPIV